MVMVVVVVAWTTCSVLTFHHATGVTGVTLRFACKSSSTKHGIIKPVIPIAVHGEENTIIAGDRIFLQILARGQAIFARIS